MQVAVRLSSELARLAGTARLSLELTPGATIRDLRRAVEDRTPALRGALDAALPLIRGTHVSPDHALTAGEEVALLLPAAGG